jgi:hypothetical protein
VRIHQTTQLGGGETGVRAEGSEEGGVIRGEDGDGRVESREEFEEARSLANVVVSGVEKRVSERGLGMVKKLRNR